MKAAVRPAAATLFYSVYGVSQPTGGFYAQLPLGIPEQPRRSSYMLHNDVSLKHIHWRFGTKRFLNYVY